VLGPLGLQVAELIKHFTNMLERKELETRAWRVRMVSESLVEPIAG
jgi:hypothetical protein